MIKFNKGKDYRRYIESILCGKRIFKKSPTNEFAITKHSLFKKTLNKTQRLEFGQENNIPLSFQPCITQIIPHGYLEKKGLSYRVQSGLYRKSSIPYQHYKQFHPMRTSRSLFNNSPKKKLHSTSLFLKKAFILSKGEAIGAQLENKNHGVEKAKIARNSKRNINLTKPQQEELQNDEISRKNIMNHRGSAKNPTIGKHKASSSIITTTKGTRNHSAHGETIRQHSINQKLMLS